MMQKADCATPDESHQQVCARYGLTPHPPEEVVAIALNTLHKSPIYGSRVQLPEGGTVSWFIHCGEHSPASGFYQTLHTSHLVDELPQVLKYLFLPAGSRFIIDREGYEDVWMVGVESSSD